MDEESAETLTLVFGYPSHEHEFISQTRVSGSHPRPLPRAGRPPKTRIGCEFCSLCGDPPKSTLRLLYHPLRTTLTKRSGSKIIYHPVAVLPVHKTVWLTSERLCSKRLEEALPEWLEYSERRSAPLPEAVKKKL